MPASHIKTNKGERTLCGKQQMQTGTTWYECQDCLTISAFRALEKKFRQLSVENQALVIERLISSHGKVMKSQDQLDIEHRAALEDIAVIALNIIEEVEECQISKNRFKTY